MSRNVFVIYCYITYHHRLSSIKIARTFDIIVSVAQEFPGGLVGLMQSGCYTRIQVSADGDYCGPSCESSATFGKLIVPCRAQTVKNLPNAGGLGSIPGSGRFSGEGNGYPPQCSCLRTPWTEKPEGFSPRSCKTSEKN